MDCHTAHGVLTKMQLEQDPPCQGPLLLLLLLSASLRVPPSRKPEIKEILGRQTGRSLQSIKIALIITLDVGLSSNLTS